MYKTYSRTKRFTMTACLAAVAFLLMFIEFPIIPVLKCWGYLLIYARQLH